LHCTGLLDDRWCVALPDGDFFEIECQLFFFELDEMTICGWTLSRTLTHAVWLRFKLGDGAIPRALLLVSDLIIKIKSRLSCLICQEACIAESPSSSQLRIGFRRRCRVGLFDAGGPSNSLGVDDHPYLACQLKCTCNHFDIYGFHCSTDAYHTCGLINITLHFVYRNCQKHLCL
jgi:hypothetical protein